MIFWLWKAEHKFLFDHRFTIKFNFPLMWFFKLLLYLRGWRWPVILYTHDTGGWLTLFSGGPIAQGRYVTTEVYKWVTTDREQVLIVMQVHAPIKILNFNLGMHQMNISRQLLHDFRIIKSAYLMYIRFWLI